MPPVIFTLTGNLLAERTLTFDTWRPGQTQRAREACFNTRGKGVNVTKMLARLGTGSIALIFSGGAPGAESEAWLRERGLAYRAFATLRPTRTGTVIQGGTQPETTFLGPDVVPDPAAVQACAEFLDQQAAGQVLALAGSFPGWSESGFAPVHQAILRWLERGRLLADVYGPPLSWLAGHPVELIKINRTEFDGLFSPEECRQSVPDRLRHLRATRPVRNWVVSDGPGSLWVMLPDGAPTEFTPPKVRELSATGSGDVLFAGIIHAWCVQHRPLPDAVAFALPLAAANAAHPGVADFELPPLK
ncbi:MAG: PfkB family carbohydrate kinase [Opitutales bacterium]